jgi:hypothetical protein
VRFVVRDSASGVGSRFRVDSWFADSRSGFLADAANWIALVVAAVGTVAAIHYHRAGLTLAHYDARAHLVVARRVLDSLTPGWQQVGAVWLPLPHLLNLVPVQIDALYRSGAFAVALSIASMAVAAWAIASLIRCATGSAIGGVVAAALLMLNPDVLYLQSTPMTEPLLFGTTFLAVALIAQWAATLLPPVLESDRTSNPGPRTSALEPRTSNLEPPAPQAAHRTSRLGPRMTTKAPGWASIAAVLTRYEAWPIIASAIVLALAVLLRRGWRMRDALRAVRGLALWPLWAIAAFLVNSKVTVGAWFVSSGFFVAENPALGRPWLAWTEVWKGLGELAGAAIPWIACAALAIIVVSFAVSRARSAGIVVLALAASAALPWYAYYKGHPVRIRYDVPLVAAAAAIAGMGVALLPRRVRAVTGTLVIAIAAWSAQPFDAQAPVIVESQRDAQNTAARRAVTSYLSAHWDGQPIMMSMGSLGHYMQDMSHAGFHIRDFLHEGNGEIWKYAIAHPRPFVEWIVVEEKAEGGDVVYWQGKLDPNFFRGYERVAEGGNVSLYRRIEGARRVEGAR